MTVKKKLTEDFIAAIHAELGDNMYKDIKDYNIDEFDIKAIANKVLFYLDINKILQIKKEN